MNKKIKIILLILILILLVLIITSTYSKYTNEADAVILREVAGWVIKVNDTDITALQGNTNATGDTAKNVVKFNITGDDLYWEGNSHTAEGKVAPGMKGHFYLRIDPEETQTALKYTINIDMTTLVEAHVNFNIINVTEENGRSLNVQNTGTTANIQRIKLLDEIKSEDENTRIDKIKVELEWIDDPAFDIFDTESAETYDKTFQIPVTINAIQYTGEGYDF